MGDTNDGGNGTTGGTIETGGITGGATVSIEDRVSKLESDLAWVTTVLAGAVGAKAMRPPEGDDPAGAEMDTLPEVPAASAV